MDTSRAEDIIDFFTITNKTKTIEPFDNLEELLKCQDELNSLGYRTEKIRYHPYNLSLLVFNHKSMP